jgi:hypothetical protein
LAELAARSRQHIAVVDVQADVHSLIEALRRTIRSPRDFEQLSDVA